MKGILKIYHPEETLKYHIKSTYSKAVYSNQKHFLEVEIITDDSLDHVDDDSLQYRFPQLSMNVYEFPLEDDQVEGKTFEIDDSDDETFTEVNLFDDEDAFLYQNELSFTQNANRDLELLWKGKSPIFIPVPTKQFLLN
ncbi:hypothetical protein LDL59_00560 [Kaistella anthropi]|nr:hypothetical protein [Kaistella anthropi]